MLPAAIQDEVSSIQADRVSGATPLVLRGLAALQAAAADAALLRETAVALCRAQPSMAGFHTAAAAAIATTDPRAALATLEARVRRATDAIARLAAPLLRIRTHADRPIRVVTCSSSTVVERALAEVGRSEALRVACSESRPGNEGLALAARLAAAGIEVEVYTDAGVSAAIPGAEALVVGADAVSERGFINKVGTAALAALARLHGVPVLVLAGRDKVLPHAVFARLPLGEAPEADLPFRVPKTAGRNPLFDRVPAEVGIDLVTDGGHLPLEACAPAGYWSDQWVSRYMSIIDANNVLDKH